jgi:hypothetical protein
MGYRRNECYVRTRWTDSKSDLVKILSSDYRLRINCNFSGGLITVDSALKSLKHIHINNQNKDKCSKICKISPAHVVENFFRADMFLAKAGWILSREGVLFWCSTSVLSFE